MHHYGLFSARYSPQTGGVESYTQNLAHELVSEGNRVTVIAGRPDGAMATEVADDGVHIVRLPAWELMNGRLPVSRRTTEYREQMRALEQVGITRVLVNTRFYRHSLEGLRFARRMDVPVVVLDHGSAYLVLGNRMADATLRAYEHAMTRRGQKFGARYAGVSSMSAAWLETFGIHTSCVIPNAIDAEAFRACASERDFRHELGLSDEQTLVVFVGRLTPEKGAPELARAAQLLGEGYAFALAGEGFLRDDILKLNVPSVHVLGLLAHDDLSALLRAGDIFCLPTRSEGFCTSLLEAGAWGLTPVMPRVGGVDEIMGDPVRFGALLSNTKPITIAHAIQKLVDTHAHGHSQHFMQHVQENFSWHATVRSLEAAFDAG